MSRLIRNPHQVVVIVSLIALVFMAGYVSGESSERQRAASVKPVQVAASSGTK